MKRILSGVLGLLFSLSVSAAGSGPGAVRKQVEASTLLTGTIVVDERGNVREHAIDQPDKIEKNVLEFVDANVANWKFEPIALDGKPVAVRNKMNIRLVAKKQQNGNFAIRISGVSFDPFARAATESAGSKGMTVTASEGGMPPPRYPEVAQRSGVQGTVYLVLQIGRDGNVLDMMPEQVNLKVVTSENAMRQWRDVFAKSAMRAAKDWKFIPPSAGEWVDEPFWSVRVPIDYTFENEGRKYGEWDAYVPGPRQQVPWRNWTDSPAFSPDTMVAGRVQQVGGKNGLRLLTPLQNG
ncbi:MAG TPA: energy transducer TonB [Pseudoxanthomonas sp.]|jgi:TonB family C-terminal domain|nr:energy transducer TonB [Pseudoxanthomonas sp.]